MPPNTYSHDLNSAQKLPFRPYFSVPIRATYTYRPRPPKATYAVPPEVGPSYRRHDLDVPQTLDQVIANGYLAIPTGDPVTAAITDRKHTSWLGLGDAISQIRVRYEMYQQNMDDILHAQCAATNAIHAWRAERGIPSDRQLDNLQKTLQSLYQQEREERVTLWRDVSRLRQAMPESAQLYLSAVRKISLLDDPLPGDSS